MTHTSAAPPVDLAQLVPGIEAHVRRTVRLHPRPGSPGVHDSHLGGPLLWPATEPWPRCGKARYCALGPDDPMIVVAQLKAADFPEIAFPDGTDLVQILWCGGFHDQSMGAEPVQVFWRRAAGVGEVLAEQPTPAPDLYAQKLVPRSCVLDPERVAEHPWYEELPGEVLDRLRAWEPDPDYEWYPPLYDEVATAPGFKVGGSMSWGTTDMPEELVCPTCNAASVLLLQLDTCEWNPRIEWDPDRVSRWQPLEERHLVPHTSEYEQACEPTGASIGRASHAGVFVCSATPQHPARFYCQ